jgi:hypothetical protein
LLFYKSRAKNKNLINYVNKKANLFQVNSSGILIFDTNFQRSFKWIILRKARVSDEWAGILVEIGYFLVLPKTADFKLFDSFVGKDRFRFRLSEDSRNSRILLPRIQSTLIYHHSPRPSENPIKTRHKFPSQCKLISTSKSLHSALIADNPLPQHSVLPIKHNKLNIEYKH